MKIRGAQKKDIPKILNLLNQVANVHADIRPDLFLRSTKYNEAALSEIIDDSNRPIFVCVDNDDVVMGYGFCILEDYSDVDVRTNIKSIYIDDICVDASKRRMGIAKKIFEAIIDFAKKNSFYNVSLNVWAGNEAALAFYTSLGMKTQKTTLEIII